MISIDPGPFTVLVVEDQALVRLDAVSCVEEAGYLAVAVANADDALLALQNGHTIDALFTDIHMPGSLDGLELARQTRGQWPDMPIVITSGQTKPSPGDLPERALFLPKPYSHREIARVLDRFLVGPQSRH
jgi:two-component system, response regulator PdtaR